MLSVQNLEVGLTHDATQTIVKNISFTITSGRVMGLWGESGSGKSTCCKAILGLLASNLTWRTGQINWHDKNILSAPSQGQANPLLGSQISYIAQDPSSSFNPLIPLGKQLEEVLIVHFKDDKWVRQQKIEAMLASLRLPDTHLLKAYAHQLSGGQLQRLALAMALLSEPQLLIADEPTTALDTLAKKEILSLIQQRVKQSGLSVLLVTHDIDVLHYIANDICILHRGEIVEAGILSSVFAHPQHNYTQQLKALQLPWAFRAQQQSRPL